MAEIPTESAAEGSKASAELTDQQILELTQAIKDEEANARPLVGSLENLDALRQEYEGGNNVFLSKIGWLENEGYQTIRRMRGDGDCFYRAFAFTYLEQILRSPDACGAAALALSTLESVTPLIKSAGFDPLVFEDFYEAFADVIREIPPKDAAAPSMTVEVLASRLQNPEVSNSIVVFLRLVTSAYLRAFADEFTAFLFGIEDGEITMDRFCSHYVEPTGKEADHIQMTALTRALKFSIRVAYLDTSGDEVDGKIPVNFVPFDVADAENNHIPTLLYRPGHYDLIAKAG